MVYGRVRHARSERSEGTATRVGGVRPPTQGQLVRAVSIAPKTNATRLAPWLCVTTVPLNGIFFTRRPAASLGGVPCGVQDRIRERQEGLFATNQRRRVCNDWPLVAALLLVLPPIVTRRPNAPTRFD